MTAHHSLISIQQSLNAPNDSSGTCCADALRHEYNHLAEIGPSGHHHPSIGRGTGRAEQDITDARRVMGALFISGLFSIGGPGRWIRRAAERQSRHLRCCVQTCCSAMHAAVDGHGVMDHPVRPCHATPRHGLLVHVEGCGWGDGIAHCSTSSAQCAQMLSLTQQSREVFVSISAQIRVYRCTCRCTHDGTNQLSWCSSGPPRGRGGTRRSAACLSCRPAYLRACVRERERSMSPL
jgi:hypothetical protein